MPLGPNWKQETNNFIEMAHGSYKLPKNVNNGKEVAVGKLEMGNQ
jgi:hypothetical protein